MRGRSTSSIGVVGVDISDCSYGSNKVTWSSSERHQQRPVKRERYL